MAHLRQHPCRRCSQHLPAIRTHQRHGRKKRNELQSRHLPQRSCRHTDSLSHHDLPGDEWRVHAGSWQPPRPEETKQCDDQLHAPARIYGHAGVWKERRRIQPCLCGRPCRPRNHPPHPALQACHVGVRQALAVSQQERMGKHQRSEPGQLTQGVLVLVVERWLQLHLKHGIRAMPPAPVLAKRKRGEQQDEHRCLLTQRAGALRAAHQQQVLMRRNHQ